MKIKNYFILSYILVISYLFIYTLGVNLNLTQQINYLNMIILFMIFILWLFSWYLFFIIDLLKSDQREKNGISLILILLAVLLFFYNPLPKPQSFYIHIDRYLFFVLSMITLVSFIIFSFKKEFFITGICILLPLSVQSFVVNILKYDALFIKYPYMVFFIIACLLSAQFVYKNIYLKNKD